jgi:hypothetical protein
MNEADWIEIVCGELNGALARKYPGGQVQASSRKRLPYRFEISSYDRLDNPSRTQPTSYQTDLLIFEVTTDGNWTPRVVVEGKLGSITSHDALTYSAKAATHVQVHPYLRYGILIGSLPSIPLRLFRHGAHFDFMIAWRGERPESDEKRSFDTIMIEEVEASRQLQEFVESNRSAERFSSIRRKLLLERHA